jgi:hypothetical protein
MYAISFNVIASHIVKIWNEIMKSIDITNFLVNIPLESDNTHKEEIAGMGSDVT